MSKKKTKNTENTLNRVMKKEGRYKIKQTKYVFQVSKHSGNYDESPECSSKKGVESMILNTLDRISL